MVQVRKILVSFSWSRKWIRPKKILTSSSTRTFLKAKFLAVCEERGEITKMLKTRSSVEGDFGAKVGKSNHELSSKRCLSFKHSSLAKLVLGFEPTSSISTYSWLRVHPCLTSGFVVIKITYPKQMRSWQLKWRKKALNPQPSVVRLPWVPFTTTATTTK